MAPISVTFGDLGVSLLLYEPFLTRIPEEIWHYYRQYVYMWIWNRTSLVMSHVLPKL